jgi:hypothetical protein
MEYNRAASGRSLIEMLGVMAIGMVMTVAAFSGIQRLRSSMNRQQVIEDVNRFVSEIRGLYAGHRGYDRALQANIMGSMNMQGSAIPNPLGGEYRIRMLGSSEPARNFKVTITGLSQSDCIHFAMRHWPDARDLQGRDNNGRALVGDGTATFGPYASCSPNVDNMVTIIFQ